MDPVRLDRPIVVGLKTKQLAALRYALREAEVQRCGVRVVHAYSLNAMQPPMVSGNVMQAAAETADEVLNTARAFVAQQGIDVPVEYVAERGLPTQVLAAESRSARSLVLGSESAAWYDHVLAGEVGRWLATHAECPVVVVPDHWCPHTTRHGGIVVTVDGATNARGPLTFAFESAVRREEELHVLHVVPPATSEADADEHRLNVAEVLAGWANDYPSVKVFQSLVFGLTDAACLAATSVANVVVVGRPRGTRLPFSLNTPVAAAIIKEADCPVAVIPTSYDGR